MRELDLAALGVANPHPALRPAVDADLAALPADAAELLAMQQTVGNAAVEAALNPPTVQDVVGTAGEPLAAGVRAEMEDRLGHDFGDVRVHTGADAHASAESLDATAYTTGEHVVFQHGAFDPGSDGGKTTLAHELTHVVQQRGGPVDGTDTGGGVALSDPGDRFEREAVATAERAVKEAPGASTVGTLHAPGGSATETTSDGPGEGTAKGLGAANDTGVPAVSEPEPAGHDAVPDGSGTALAVAAGHTVGLPADAAGAAAAMLDDLVTSEPGGPSPQYGLSAAVHTAAAGSALGALAPGGGARAAAGASAATAAVGAASQLSHVGEVLDDVAESTPAASLGQGVSHPLASVGHAGLVAAHGGAQSGLALYGGASAAGVPSADTLAAPAHGLAALPGSGGLGGVSGGLASSSGSASGVSAAPASVSAVAPHVGEVLDSVEIEPETPVGHSASQTTATAANVTPHAASGAPTALSSPSTTVDELVEIETEGPAAGAHSGGPSSSPHAASTIANSSGTADSSHASPSSLHAAAPHTGASGASHASPTSAHTPAAPASGTHAPPQSSGELPGGLSEIEPSAPAGGHAPSGGTHHPAPPVPPASPGPHAASSASHPAAHPGGAAGSHPTAGGAAHHPLGGAASAHGPAPAGGAPAVGSATPAGGDPLAAWHTSIQGATTAVAAPAVPATAGADLTAQASAVDADRRARQPDFAAEASARVPAPPAEPPRQSTLDTSVPDRTIAGVRTAAAARLSDQTFPAMVPMPSFGPTGHGGGGGGGGALTPATSSNAAAQASHVDAAPVCVDPAADQVSSQVTNVTPPAAATGTAGQQTVISQPPAPPAPTPAQGAQIGEVLGTVKAHASEYAQQFVDAGRERLDPGKRVAALTPAAAQLLPDQLSAINGELEGAARTAAGATQAMTAAVAAHQANASQQTVAATDQVSSAAATAHTQVGDREQQQLQSVDGARAAADAHIESRQAAAQGTPDAAAINAKRDTYLGALDSAVSAGAAAFRAAGEARGTELDRVAGLQRAAYRRQGDAEARRILTGSEADTEAQINARKAHAWVDTQCQNVDARAAALKRDANAEVTRLTGALQSRKEGARDQIRDWAAAQQGRERSWWERLLDSFHDWAQGAKSDTAAWQEQRATQTRNEVAGDFALLARLREQGITSIQQMSEEERSRLTADQLRLVQRFLLSGGGDPITTVAQMLVSRLKDRRVPDIAKSLEQQAIATLGADDLNVLGQAQSPGFNARATVNQLVSSMRGLGTKEEQLFAALGGHTPLQIAAIRKMYASMNNGASLDEALTSELSGTEKERADAMMSGDPVASAVASLHDAVDGLGTNTAQIMATLRGKTAAERDAIIIAYREKYGVELVADLDDDLSGNEAGEAHALLNGDAEGADAYHLANAMDGPGTDEVAIHAAYARIRAEVEAQAQATGMTTAEMNAEILRRNRLVAERYGVQHGGGDGALEAAITDELTDGGDNPDHGELNLALGEMHNNQTEMDAAQLQIEHESTYTDDDHANAILRHQYDRAKADVLRDARAAIQRDPTLTPAQRAERLAHLEDDPQVKAAITAAAQANMNALHTTFDTNMQGTEGPGAFDNFIEHDFQGVSKNEAHALVQQSGDLSPAQKLRYAIEGLGTNEAAIREVLRGKSREEIEAIKAEYYRLTGRTLVEDLHGDLDGRDLADADAMLNGSKTPEERAAYLAQRAEWETEHGTGVIGDLFDDTEEANLQQSAHDAQDAYEAYQRALHENPQDPAKVAAALERFDRLAGYGELDIEAHREAVDTIADTGAMVAATVVGITVAVLSAGTAAPAVAAGIASLAGTLGVTTATTAAVLGAVASAAAGIAVRSMTKGDAYGNEDLATDLAQGLVDAVVAGATAGTGEAILKSLMEAPAFGILRQAAQSGALTPTAKAALQGAIEGAMGGAVSGAAGAMLHEDTWHNPNPLGVIVSGAGHGAAQGAAMGAAMGGAMQYSGLGHGPSGGGAPEPAAPAAAAEAAPPHAAPETAPHPIEPTPHTVEPTPPAVEPPHALEPVELPDAQHAANDNASPDLTDLPNPGAANDNASFDLTDLSELPGGQTAANDNAVPGTEAVPMKQAVGAEGYDLQPLNPNNPNGHPFEVIPGGLSDQPRAMAGEGGPQNNGGNPAAQGHVVELPGPSEHAGSSGNDVDWGELADFPSTEPPSTEPRSTEPPGTEPPHEVPLDMLVDFPSNEPPSTEPSSTEPPSTEPPSTEPPSAEPASAEPPAEAPPEPRQPKTPEEIRAEQEAARQQCQEALAENQADLDAANREKAATEAKRDALKELCRDIRNQTAANGRKLAGLNQAIRNLADKIRGLQVERGRLTNELTQRGRVLRALGETGALERVTVPGTDIIPCFTGETLVWTGPATRKRIDSLTPGDPVLVWDFGRDRATVSTLRNLGRSTTAALVHLRVRGRLVRSTRDHRFWSVDRDDWVPAVELTVGEKLLLPDGEPTPVEAHEVHDTEPVTTYNLAVDTIHNYFVGPGALVHNGAPIAVYPFGPILIYRGTNPRFPGRVYIGQTLQGTAERQRQHRADALERARNPNRTPEQIAFDDFMAGVVLEPVVGGLNQNMADYMEQVNINHERTIAAALIEDDARVMNRREQVSAERMAELRALIEADPAVQAYMASCP
ncbi:eCIS core domain-containing protein [Yinghuangia seranimata]|uniref:eCIS core domain-containing protein n=1 Tax=Yinghuangia seranimata TaxID=408067 RepID=UPI00248BC98A|nr:DUF4157 domain-containing protein [Yinghuangia seranimata]MDI2125253.1 DUF4157 domain-containing protein [Yinghuangia seranimata]